jgi:hypothetical protein
MAGPREVKEARRENDDNTKGKSVADNDKNAKGKKVVKGVRKTAKSKTQIKKA